MSANDPTTASNGIGSYGLTIKGFLVPLLTRPKIAKAIKYGVYGALCINFFLYLIDDYQAYTAALPDGAPWGEVLTQFSTTIDMTAWLGLVFLFELETYALPDEAFEGWIPAVLKGLRTICYLAIAFSAWGYYVETLDFYNVSPVETPGGVCDLADQGIWLQYNVIDYVEIGSDNCSELTDGSQLWQAAGEVSVMDSWMLGHGRFLGWIDVLNAVVWLLVVFLIEVEVYLQTYDRFSSRALKAARVTKTALYLVLIGNAIIWISNSYPLYAWDAFLWIFGFWAIELNLAEWEQDRLKELRAAAAGS